MQNVRIARRRKFSSLMQIRYAVRSIFRYENKFLGVHCVSKQLQQRSTTRAIGKKKKEQKRKKYRLKYVW